VAMRLSPMRKRWFRRPALLAISLLQSRRTGDALRHDTRPFLPSPPVPGG
jgi:hypothetical protein